MPFFESCKDNNLSDPNELGYLNQKKGLRSPFNYFYFIILNEKSPVFQSIEFRPAQLLEQCIFPGPCHIG